MVFIYRVSIVCIKLVFYFFIMEDLACIQQRFFNYLLCDFLYAVNYIYWELQFLFSIDNRMLIFIFGVLEKLEWFCRVFIFWNKDLFVSRYVLVIFVNLIAFIGDLGYSINMLFKLKFRQKDQQSGFQFFVLLGLKIKMQREFIFNFSFIISFVLNIIVVCIIFCENFKR